MKKIWLALLLLVGMFICTSCTTTDNPPVSSDDYDFKTPQTDALKLTESYEGKEFIKDGIGVVTPVRYIDGDTSVFRSGSTEFTVRYNGVNTPESTYKIEPWGFVASKFNKKAFADALAQGAKVVLQTEDMSNRLDSTNVRYLAWVWFVYPNGDSRLLNLDIVEHALGQDKSSQTQYEQYFSNATFDVAQKKLRIYGEIDKDFDYSTDAKEITIREIREKYGTEEAVNQARESFAPPLIKVSGVVVRKNGPYSAYIQQYDEETNQYYGIYVYGGFGGISKLRLNSSVQITAKIGYYYGSLQITDVKDSKIKVYSFDEADSVNISEETCDAINDIYAYEKIGTLVKVSDLTVTGGKNSDNNTAFTIYCSYTDANGKSQRLNIRVDQNIALYDPSNPSTRITGWEYFNGKTIESIIGIVAYYNGATSEPDNDYANGHIQLALTSMDDIVLK